MSDKKETTTIIDGLVYKWDKPWYFVICDTVYHRRAFKDEWENYYFDDCYWVVLE